MQYPLSWSKGAALGEQIANELRLRIISGSIEQGDVLSENGIARDFGTSRSPVREALKTLSNEGLIRLERMGAVVIGMGLKDIEELYDVRFLIESFAQKQLANGDQQKLFVTLNQIIDKMELAAKYHDPIEFAYQDMTFHETIIKAAHHARILNLWNSIRQIVLTVMLITTEKEVFSQGDEHIHWVIDKHRKIIKGLASQNNLMIEEAVEAYFADSKHTLGQAFEKNPFHDS